MGAGMLDVEDLDRLTKILESRSIPMEVLENMIELFNYHDHEGRELLFELLGEFQVCEFEQYKKKGSELAEALMQDVPSSVKTIVLLPLLDKVPASKSKSGDAIAWIMSRSLGRLAKATGREFKMASQTISAEIISRGDATAFFMVDDYIGSGNTALGAVEGLVQQGVHAAQISVAAFVGMAEAGTRLASAGVRTIFLANLPKGISGSSRISNKNYAIEVMLRMENKMKVGRRFELGYERTEALVLMCFCPNNTFPVFWWKGPTWGGYSRDE